MALRCTSLECGPDKQSLPPRALVIAVPLVPADASDTERGHWFFFFFFLTWELDAQLAQIPGADADDARPIRGSPPT